MGIDRKSFLHLAVTGGLGALLGGSGKLSERWKERGVSLTAVNRRSLVMGSIISFQVIAETESAGYEAIRKAERIFRSLENIFSMYDPKSEMAKLAGRAGRETMSVSDEAHELLQFAKQIHSQSGGKFDVTVEPAMRRWGFRDNPGRSIQRPTNRELREMERIIGSEKIQIEDHKILLAEAGMALDTGGIAGGYALDKAINVMKKCDISAAFINFSGDIHCFGKPLEDEGWPVYLLDPQTRQPQHTPIKLLDKALSTSGAYQNRRHDENRRSWGHLLNPDKAAPLETVGSITAIHPSAMVADAWSTAAFVGADSPSSVQTIILKD